MLLCGLRLPPRRLGLLLCRLHRRFDAVLLRGGFGQLLVQRGAAGARAADLCFEFAVARLLACEVLRQHLMGVSGFFYVAFGLGDFCGFVAHTRLGCEPHAHGLFELFGSFGHPGALGLGRCVDLLEFPGAGKSRIVRHLMRARTRVLARSGDRARGRLAIREAGCFSFDAQFGFGELGAKLRQFGLGAAGSGLGPGPFVADLFGACQREVTSAPHLRFDRDGCHQLIGVGFLQVDRFTALDQRALDVFEGLGLEFGRQLLTRGGGGRDGR